MRVCRAGNTIISIFNNSDVGWVNIMGGGDAVCDSLETCL